MGSDSIGFKNIDAWKYNPSVSSYTPTINMKSNPLNILTIKHPKSSLGEKSVNTSEYSEIANMNAMDKLHVSD